MMSFKIIVTLISATIIANSWAEILPDEAKRDPSRYFYDDSVVYDETAGIKDDITFTGNDDDRLSLQYHFSYDFSNIADLQGFQIGYGRKVSDSLWVEGIIQKINGTFGLLAENQTPDSSNTNAQAESRNIRNDDESASVMLYGIGVGYRFKFLSDSFSQNSEWFETVNTYLTYNNFDDPYHTYGGWGFKADYGIHKRINSTFFMGGRVSYNWALVETSANEIAGQEVPAPDRRLMLAWLNLAFEIGYYY